MTSLTHSLPVSTLPSLRHLCRNQTHLLFLGSFLLFCFQHAHLLRTAPFVAQYPFFPPFSLFDLLTSYIPDFSNHHTVEHIELGIDRQRIALSPVTLLFPFKNFLPLLFVPLIFISSPGGPSSFTSYCHHCRPLLSGAATG